MLKRKLSDDDRVIDVQTFMIDGEDVIPIFSDTDTFKAQAVGSGFEDHGLEIKFEFYLDLPKGHEVFVLNPGGNNPTRLTASEMQNWGKE